GTLFDNSFERGEPSEFGLTQVIDGWTETLLLMKPGQTVLVRIPWKLAYGESGSGTTIPPRADLVFLVQVIDFLE
ncbi:MAG: FKBP-type peptidyl-prolyl cis-trans isomerase, partial [Planctomycetota bacterium]